MAFSVNQQQFQINTQTLYTNFIYKLLQLHWLLHSFFRRLGQTYTEGSKLQFLCQPPYRLVGDEFRTCSSEKRKSNTPTGDGNGGWRRAGDWSGTQPTCVPPTCPKVDTINDGIVIV